MKIKRYYYQTHCHSPVCEGNSPLPMGAWAGEIYVGPYQECKVCHFMAYAWGEDKIHSWLAAQPPESNSLRWEVIQAAKSLGFNIPRRWKQ